jgi:hypothetical protein
MVETPLAAKMKLKSGNRAAVINAPEGYLLQLVPPQDEADIATTLDGTFDWVQLFVYTKAELDGLISQAAQALRPGSILWISFPKGSSKSQTDLTRDKGWEKVETFGLKWVTLISLNETWSAFSLRPYKPGEEKQPLRYS